MVPLTLADEVEVAHGRGREIQFTCNDPEIPLGSENLCVKAAEAFLTATGIEHGLTVSLMKRIPHGAGLGGGSSDAATVLCGLNELFDAPLVSEELHHLATQLGSDVPFFLEKRPAWCRGRGEILEAAEALPQRRVLLIKPPFPVPTAWAYKRYAEMSQASETPVEEIQFLEGITLINDLESPVFDKYLLLPVMKQWLRGQACVEAAFMTGSGSTMVAILVPDATQESVTSLKGKLSDEFGATLWISETEFLKG